MAHRDKTFRDDDILLQVRELKTWFGPSERPLRAVDGVSFDIKRGETFALLGESGCGKSMTALSLMQLVPSPGGRIVAGEVLFQGQDILRLSEQQMRGIRGNRIAMIFQEPMTSLNPVLTIGEQIAEVLRFHQELTPRQAQDRVLQLLDAVGIPDPRRRLRDYPHQLSGGMKQRVMIAIALACEPELLIADEPTTALDVTIQAQVLDLLRTIQDKMGMSILLITHDLGVVAGRVDRLAVMYAGQIVEEAGCDVFFSTPGHPYSRKLFAALPTQGKRGQRLETIEGVVPALDSDILGCRFAPRCEAAWQACHERPPLWHSPVSGQRVRCHLYAPDHVEKERAATTATATKAVEAVQAPRAEAVMTAVGLKVHFPIRKGVFKHKVGAVYALDSIELSIKKGQTLALVGESGCGKTTAGKALLQLIRPTAGSVKFHGQELTTLKGASLRRLRARFQIIFQDPYASLNPRMMIGNILEEGMLAQKIGGDSARREARIDALLEQVGLPVSAKNRYPHEFSGGQRQRISIARALAVEPEVIVCDEPTSALDVSVQAQTLNLLKELQDQLGLGYLFITHNISVVEYLAHDVAVMYLGRIVEKGPAQAILDTPRHPYTQALLSAVPVVELEKHREIIRLEGELPSPIHPPSGCHFHPRCPVAEAKCREVYPETTVIGEAHEVRCHRFS